MYSFKRDFNGTCFLECFFFFFNPDCVVFRIRHETNVLNEKSLSLVEFLVERLKIIFFDNISMIGLDFFLNSLIYDIFMISGLT